MKSTDVDLSETIARHEAEITELRVQVNALRDGYAKEQLQGEIARRISELEADIKLQELQETIAKEAADKQRKRRLFGRR